MTTDRRYHLHEGLPVQVKAVPTVSECTDCHGSGDKCRNGAAKVRGSSCQNATNLHTMHAQITLAYYVDSRRLATHGSPEGMAAWAALHNSHSPHQVALYHFDKGASLEDVNSAILIPAVLQGLLRDKTSGENK